MENMKQIQKEIRMMHAGICQAIADPKRILILYTLHEKEYHVTALADLLELPQPTISRHLRVLHQNALVNKKRAGAAVYYSLADSRVIKALDIMRAVMVDALTQQSDLF